MIDNLCLGIKDIWNNKKIFISFLLMIFTILILSVSSTSSVVRELVNPPDRSMSYRSFRVELINMDMSENNKIVKDVYEIFKEDGGSYFNSYDLQMKLSERVLILVGNRFEMYGDGDKTTIYTTPSTKEKIQSGEILSEEIEYEFRPRDEIYIEEIEESVGFSGINTIIVLQTSKFDKWINVDYYSEIIELIENTEFSKKEISEDLKNEFIGVFEATSYLVEKTVRSDHLGFILKNIYLMLLLAIIAVILSTYILYNAQLKKLYKEYTIHLIYGATIKDIFIRNSVFLGLCLAIDFTIFMYLNKFNFNDYFIIGFITMLIMLCIFEILLWFVLKRKDLLNNLKGGI